ncbi:MAG: DotU family type IV/VI secretion system protein [Phycisphaerales bacterium]
MTLLELCEPLFQYVCRLNRLARKGASIEPEEVRSQVRQMLTTMRTKANAVPGLGPQFEKVELPLIFFVDFMIRDSALPFARRWHDLAQERNELAGDEKFFDLLEETLAERSDAATDRLSVFYTCMGLGFTGWFQGQPEFLRKKMKEIAGRLRARGDQDMAGKLCPDAYENVNTSDLIQPPGRSLTGVGILLIGLVVVLFAGNVFLYQRVVGDLSRYLTEVTKNTGGEGK